MAEEITVPMEEESLSSLLADEPEAPKEQPEETAQEKEDRARDEKGRFVAKTEEETPQVEATQEPDKDAAQVPSWRLRELREQREAAESRATEQQKQNWQLQQQLAEMQRQIQAAQKPAQDPVDFFQDPESAFQQRVAPIEERYAQLEARMRLNTSRAMAIATHGAPAVSEMEKAVELASQQNHPDLPALSAQMRNSDDPVGLAMQWYKRNSLVEKTGGDLDAYVQKQMDEKLKDPAFLAKALEAARAQAGGSPAPKIQLPPSLNKAPGSANTGSPDDNDMSDRSLFQHATAGRR